MGLVRLSSLRLCNHITDQFSRIELTRGRKAVEMNSGLSVDLSVDLDLLASVVVDSCQTVPPRVG